MPFSFFGRKWHSIFWNELKINFPIFAISIFWVVVDFVHNFPVFLTDQKCCLKRCAMFWNGCFTSWFFFCANFSFWDMVDFVFNSELGVLRDFYEPDSETQTSDTREQVSLGDLSKSIGGVGGEEPQKTGSLTYIIFLNSSKSWIRYKGQIQNIFHRDICFFSDAQCYDWSYCIPEFFLCDS